MTKAWNLIRAFFLALANNFFWLLTRHADQIILPHAVSDTFSILATIKNAALIQAVAS